VYILLARITDYFGEIKYAFKGRTKKIGPHAVGARRAGKPHAGETLVLLNSVHSHSSCPDSIPGLVIGDL
jgi:hypothetical protein